MSHLWMYTYLYSGCHIWICPPPLMQNHVPLVHFWSLLLFPVTLGFITLIFLAFIQRQSHWNMLFYYITCTWHKTVNNHSNSTLYKVNASTYNICRVGLAYQEREVQCTEKIKVKITPVWPWLPEMQHLGSAFLRLLWVLITKQRTKSCVFCWR